MKKINLSSVYPIIDIEDNVAFAGNGNLILCYRVRLPEIYSLSQKDFEELHDIWLQAFKSLPVGTVIHKQDIYQKKTFNADQLHKATFLQEATHNHFKGRIFIEHMSYLFFIWTKNKSLNNPKYVNPFKMLTRAIIQSLDGVVKQFVSSVKDSVAFINNSRKIEIIPLDADKIHGLTQQYFNGFNQGYYTDIVLDAGKVKSPITIGDNHFDLLAINSELCFGDKVQTSKPNEGFTSKDYTFHQGFFDSLGLSLRENHMVNQIIYLDNKHKWRKILERKIQELAKSTHFGSENKVVQKKLESLLGQINSDDQARVIRGHLNILYWARSKDQLEQIGAHIKAELKELDITAYQPRAGESKNYFLNSYFAFSSNFGEEALYVTDLKHALCLFINNTNYGSDHTGILFNDREQNIPVQKDLWDSEKKLIKARNFAIFAPTGEGKSFLANNILRQYFEDGVRLVIIDLGGSYSKFAKLYYKDCAVLRYETGKNLGINPFYISSVNDLTHERFEDLAVFLFELVGSETKPSKAQLVSLKKILVHYYKTSYGQVHSLHHFYSFLEGEQRDLLQTLQIHPGYFNISDFLHILSEYVGQGLYSFLFKVTSDQSYKLEEKRLIIFELDEVRDNKEILSVMLKLIKSAIERTIWKNPSEKGIILFDEFAKQLKFPNVMESVEYYYQAIRKQNGAIGIILQSINQLPENSTSASILENTQVIYSLFNEKGYDELGRRLNLSDHDLTQLRSISNNLGGENKYTEIFIKIGKQSNVYRLEVPPTVYAAYLTDGPENDRIMRIYEKTHNMESAIKEFVSLNSNQL